MAKQSKNKQSKSETTPRTHVPDKDKYTAGGPRPRPHSPYADNPPKRSNSSDDQGDERTSSLQEHAASTQNAGKWKQEDTPPYAKTYDRSLNEEGEPE